jgi:dihydrofolate reductase
MNKSTNEQVNQMNIALVVVADENNGIGINNGLLCYLPADLKHFKRLTIGYPVIMGRKTFDSVGKPLPGRRNIIITKQDLKIEGCEITHSIEEAIEKCNGEERIAIVGGSSIYKQSIHLANIIYLTRIHHSFEADSFFPDIDPGKWIEVEKEYHEADEKNAFPYSFITYRKR